jgi:hypothetical protein
MKQIFEIERVDGPLTSDLIAELLRSHFAAHHHNKLSVKEIGQIAVSDEPFCTCEDSRYVGILICKDCGKPHPI